MSKCTIRKRPDEVDGYISLSYYELEMVYYNYRKPVYFTLNDLAPYSELSAFTQKMEYDLEMDSLAVLLKVYENKYRKAGDYVSLWCI